MTEQVLLDDLNRNAIHLMWVLEEAGFEARIAGGAVRDFLRGVAPKDWDIATTALPEQVIEIMSARGYQTIPTGLQHGTVTVVFGDNFEITTLRVDKTTDGRHAEVEFTDDWRMDAARRDFTVNAMYIDSQGVVHDYFGGLADLLGVPPLVRFVGDSEHRIREDYLRIMRYFRFRIRLEGGFDHHWSAGRSTMNVIADHAENLKQISGERIWSELRQMIVLCSSSRKRKNHTDIAQDLFRALDRTGVLAAIGLKEFFDGWEKGVRWSPSHWREGETGFHPSIDPITNLLTFCHADRREEFLDYMKTRFRVSNEELRIPRFMLHRMDAPKTVMEKLRMLAHGVAGDEYMAWLYIHASASPLVLLEDEVLDVEGLCVRVLGGGSFPTLDDLMRQIPLVSKNFPINGGDLARAGVKPGPAMGKLLSGLRNYWADSRFTETKEKLIEERLPLLIKEIEDQ